MSSFYTLTKNLVQKYTGIRFYRSNPPWGHELHADIVRLGSSRPPAVVFDVGANIGQSTARVLEAFPQAFVHGFEPMQATYNEYHSRFAGDARVRCHRMALGEKTGTVRIVAGPGSSETAHINESEPAGEGETVTVGTVDSFCAARSIEHIDLLKIDTEGHDLMVLAGASQMLEHKAVGMILVETKLCEYHSPENPCQPHIFIGEFSRLLNPLGYRCLGLYEQMFSPGWGVYYANALFVRISDHP